jgi:mono/diheme cytochrome c family protein
MPARALFLCLFLLGAMSAAWAGGVTSKPDPANGKALAERLCTNCHIVNADQEQAIADIPSFKEIGSRPGQTEGTIMAFIVLPKHPMPQIPLTKSELADLSAYILSLGKSE